MIYPICYIVPPHILREIVKKGNNKQRAWALQTLTISEQFRGRREVVSLMPSVFAVAGEKRRTVYDAKSEYDLPGTLVRGEGDPSTGDVAVDEAYDGAGATYDLYKNVFDRNSIDDKGMRLDLTVHYGVNYDNAFWNGSQMVFGDGDGEIFQRFTKSIDVIGHELTHGVTDYEARLVYWDQPGALNEHMSDVFGSLVRQYVLKQTADQADWLIGEGLLTPNINGKALRSMKEPGTAYDDPLIGKDPQPAHMKDYMDVDYDNGGVHINSGIPNRAFYLTAIEIGGYVWEKAGQTWYIALRDRLRRKSNFQSAANITFDIAGDLFGSGSKEQEAVRKGWEGVGITVKKKKKK
ncbi:MAG: M4 family metallopeptidase [archaeon]|nr:M4 family metallopeptidase [archaeon]MCP8320346.1 M4 family metallopeptidase [archaeon]